MSEISREALVGKLNATAMGALEKAYASCRQRGTPQVELAHWVYQLLQTPDSDVAHAVRAFALEPSRLEKEMTQALDALPRGASYAPGISPQIDSAVERAWVHASLIFGETGVRSGHVLLGILSTQALRQILFATSAEWKRISADDLTARWSSVTAGSVEDAGPPAAAAAPTAGAAAPQAAGEAAAGKQAPAGKQALARFAVDLTARARERALDPVLGRDDEIRQMVDVLMRRRQNNPLLAGEAGVGKTAVVEGLALRIAAGAVPPALKDVALWTLDIGLMQAGAGARGEFEQRLRSVIDEVQSSAKPIVLFIDEVHTLIGAGGAAGTGDAANLLKPALARGKLRTVAATTWSEYKKHIEPDPALTRRFQVIQVPEPDEARALLMMRGLAATLEKHHKVQILDEALEATVRLSHRHIPSRQLPDKAVSLLDTACARVAVSQDAVPPAVEDSRRRIEDLETELTIIAREQATGLDTTSRAAAANQKVTAERARLAEVEGRWNAEKEVVVEIVALRTELRAASAAAAGAAAPDAKAEAKLTKLRGLQERLRELQGEAPLVLPIVDTQAVASVVADWTGIPVGRMARDEIRTVLALAETLGGRVLGQRHALEEISNRILVGRARLENPGKPLGVFMLVGPSGVGKTETALTLAESLYGGEQNLITFNMSEFKEPHTVSQLKGAPPGYVGYGEGGLLTEAVRRRPHSVVLLDEFEKAHRAVHDMFLQVFDKGWMEDATGRFIDFSSTVILLTSNVGSDAILSVARETQAAPEGPEVLNRLIRPHLLRAFPAELLGRVVVVPYFPLSDELLGAITRLQLSRLVKRVQQNHNAALVVSDEAVRLITSRCVEVESGGRMIDSIITGTLVPRLGREILNRSLAGGSLSRATVGVDNGDFSFTFS
jgi:type VI secretion system protein VasG